MHIFYFFPMEKADTEQQKISVHQTILYLECQRTVRCVWSYLDTRTMFLEPFQHVSIPNLNLKATTFEELCNQLIAHDMANNTTTFASIKSTMGHPGWPWINFVYTTQSKKLFTLDVIRNDALQQQSPKLATPVNAISLGQTNGAKHTTTTTTSDKNLNGGNDRKASKKSIKPVRPLSKKTLLDNITILCTYLYHHLNDVLIDIVAYQWTDDTETCLQELSFKASESVSGNSTTAETSSLKTRTLNGWKIKENDWPSRTLMQKLICLLKNSNGRGCLKFVLKYTPTIVQNLQNSKLAQVISDISVQYTNVSTNVDKKNIGQSVQSTNPTLDASRDNNANATKSVANNREDSSNLNPVLVVALQEFRIYKKCLKSLSQSSAIHFFDLLI